MSVYQHYIPDYRGARKCFIFAARKILDTTSCLRLTNIVALASLYFMICLTK